MAILKSIGGFCTFVWNPKTKEFLGRDGASWAKISFFYFIFYIILSSAFVGMLAVFRQTLDDKRPTYYDKSSTMNVAKDYETGKNNVNPGLGFRPQLDPESSLITYSMSALTNPESTGDFTRLNKSMNQFLNRYYNESSDPSLEIKGCEKKDISEVRDFLKQNKHCPVDYKAIIDNRVTNSDSDPFGFQITGPLILLKLNKIYNWLPKPLSLDNLPGFLYDLRNKTDDATERAKLEKTITENVIVKCFGEYTADADQVSHLEPKYFSIGENGAAYQMEFGYFPFYYYPYLNQDNYESPLVFLQFTVGTNKNILTNVLCRAYAGNIDNQDKLNRRGMTQFSLFVKD